ncbi:MAG TPA: hypothetical protein VMQ11_19385 [Alphaproteobacteria bacterium]|nr:hypothetical protein [Alphaproteobacteria bacterium]
MRSRQLSPIVKRRQDLFLGQSAGLGTGPFGAEYQAAGPLDRVVNSQPTGREPVVWRARLWRPAGIG